MDAKKIKEFDNSRHFHQGPATRTASHRDQALRQKVMFLEGPAFEDVSKTRPMVTADPTVYNATRSRIRPT